MTSLTATPQVDAAIDLRVAILKEIDYYLRQAVTIPSGEHGDVALAAFEVAVTAYQSLVTTLMAPADLRIATRLLSDDEKDGLKQVEHNLKIMRALYGPKEA